MSSCPHLIRSILNVAISLLKLSKGTTSGLLGKNRFAGWLRYGRNRLGKVMMLITMLLIQIPAVADALPASIDAGADQDITTLWVVGDIDVLAKGLNAVAMFFNGAGTGSPLISLLQLGAMLALTSMLVQFITKRTMQPFNTFLMIIIVSALFIPKTSVWVASYYDAKGGATGGAVGFRKVDNVPIGVAYPLGLFSYVSKRLTEQYDTGMQVMPDSAMTGGTTAPEGGILTHGAEGYFSPLRTVLRLRNQFSGPENALLLHNLSEASKVCNWGSRWSEADKGGIFNVLTRGNQSGMVRIVLPGAKPGEPMVEGLVGCSDAGKIISLMMVQNVVNLPGKNYSPTAVSVTSNRNLSAIKGSSINNNQHYERTQAELDQLPAAMAAAACRDAEGRSVSSNANCVTDRSGAAMGIGDPTAILNTVRSQIQQGQVQPAALAQVFTAGNSVSAAEIEANMIFSNIVHSCIGGNDGECARQAFMLSEARNRAAIDAAGEASAFQTFMGHSMNILMFIYIVMAPIMIFIILVMGWNGIRVMGSYLMFAAWINSWLPLNSAIAYYMLQNYNNRMHDLILAIAASDEPTRIYSPTVINGIFNSTQDMLASASTMMSSVPLVMLSFMGASIYGLVQLAQRANMVGKDFIDEDKAAPKLDQSEVIGTARMIANSSAGGVLTTDNFNQNLVHNADASNPGSINLQTSQDSIESARHAISSKIQMMEGATESRTLAEIDSDGVVKTTGIVYAKTESGEDIARIARQGDHAVQSGESFVVGASGGKIITAGVGGEVKDTVTYTDSNGQSHDMKVGTRLDDTEGIQTAFGKLDSHQISHSVQQGLSDAREEMRSIEHATSSTTSHGFSSSINRTAFDSLLEPTSAAVTQNRLSAGATEAAKYDRAAGAALQNAIGNNSEYFNTLTRLYTGSSNEQAAALAAIHGMTSANPSAHAQAYHNLSAGALAVHTNANTLHSSNQEAIDAQISADRAEGIGKFAAPLGNKEALEEANPHGRTESAFATRHNSDGKEQNNLSLEDRQKILAYNRAKMAEMTEFNNNVAKELSERGAVQKFLDYSQTGAWSAWHSAGEQLEQGDYVGATFGYAVSALDAASLGGGRVLRDMFGSTQDSKDGMPAATLDPELNEKINQVAANRRMMEGFSMSDATKTIDGKPIEEVIGHKLTPQADSSQATTSRSHEPTGTEHSPANQHASAHGRLHKNTSALDNRVEPEKHNSQSNATYAKLDAAFQNRHDHGFTFREYANGHMTKEWQGHKRFGDGDCALNVRMILDDSGMNPFGKGTGLGDGKNVAARLLSTSQYERVPFDRNMQFQHGDVISLVNPRNPNAPGHVAIYNAHTGKWVSDFEQERKWGAPGKTYEDAIASGRITPVVARFKGLSNTTVPLDHPANPSSQHSYATNIRGFTPEKAAIIERVARNIGANPNDLAAVISFETVGTFSPSIKNPHSSATGLIQFMEYTDGRKDGLYFGMTRDQFGALSFERQMGFVENYFKDRGFRANKPTNIADLYTAVSGYGYRKGSAAYELNSVWDTNRNNVIEKGEMVEAPEFKQHRRKYFL